MKVFLTGFMAAGKSAVGRRLGRIAGVPFLDLDADIENRARKRISEIFTEGGEAAFREFERAALEDAVLQESVIVAAGGGVVVDVANRRLMRKSGTIVWLDTDLELILERLKKPRPSRRPLATSEKELRELFRRRVEAYRDCDLRIVIGAEDPVEVVAERVLARLGAPKCGT